MSEEAVKVFLGWSLLLKSPIKDALLQLPWPCMKSGLMPRTKEVSFRRYILNLIRKEKVIFFFRGVVGGEAGRGGAARRKTAERDAKR